jgi:hypothetical protein
MKRPIGNQQTLLVASICVVVALAGCHDNSIVGFGDGGDSGVDAGDGGTDGGVDAGDGGDAGADAGDTDAGPPFDAGTCQIDGGFVPAGAWKGNNACIVCEPTVNPRDWTVFDAGDPCEIFLQGTLNGPVNIAAPGICLFDPFFGFNCTAVGAGNFCDAGTPCVGGYCSDAGWCVTDQDLGIDSVCDNDNMVPYTCAYGPCCLDAGLEGVPDGGGWCCGLIDGGRPVACLPIDGVCYDTSNCCEGLRCVGHDGFFGVDSGYGLCR